MAGIAGVGGRNQTALTGRLLDRLQHRGTYRAIREFGAATLGIVQPRAEGCGSSMDMTTVADSPGDGHFAEASVGGGRLLLRRDPLGVCPLYEGKLQDGTICFASEVKALVGVARDITEVTPGATGREGEKPTTWMETGEPLKEGPREVAAALRSLLDRAIARRISGGVPGAWLSGGLDSSLISSLVRMHMPSVHTFAAGMEGAPDLEHAREVSAFIGSRHHEIIVSMEDMLAALPDVIYHLESFDALLVRSSVMNYLASAMVADYVSDVFSGEGADELFAGYAYLKEIAAERLPHELLDITGRLHNTALQRVDRCAGAHGLVPHVCFLDPQVVRLAMRIPVEWKLREGVEKWILRVAAEGLLPRRITDRPKSKFWEGSGVESRLAAHAESIVSDADFRKERTIPNGWKLASKEELFYYRMFRERFGEMEDLDWMGRTKNASRGG